MSLSHESPVNITLSTPRDICDDIWAGAIQYAKEAGFCVNPLVTTTLWSGLLLSIKPELEKHGIFKQVQKEFIPSLSNIYSIGLDNVELLADIKQRQQMFWEIISTDDMNNLRSDSEIFLFIQLVDQINSQFVQQHEGLPLIECAALFKKFRTLLASHVYHILRKTDSDMTLQFREAKSTLSQPIRKQTPQAAPQSAKPPDAGSKDKGKKKALSILMRIIVALIILNIIVLMVTFWPSETAQSATTPTTAQVQQLNTKPRPANGRLLHGSWSNESEITVNASAGEDCVVLLKTASGITKLAFFVRSGETATVGVPAEKYYVYFASGKDWYGYGKGKMFGEKTSYSKDDELLDFSMGGWEYTLYPVTNGNFSETPINEGDFF